MGRKRSGRSKGQASSQSLTSSPLNINFASCFSFSPSWPKCLSGEVPGRSRVNTSAPPQADLPEPKALPFHECSITDLGGLGLIAFYFPGAEEVWDKACGSAFLGNFYPGKLEMRAPGWPGRSVSFENAEAAFQALKFWHRAEEFRGLSGQQAFWKKRELEGQEDWSYGGHGSNWRAMLAVLRAKFEPGSRMAWSLLQTGDAFLLEHNSVKGRDMLWSDDYDGEGKNWLGLQLMLVRAELRKCYGKQESAWGIRLQHWFDCDMGMPEDSHSAGLWRDLVTTASDAVRKFTGSALQHNPNDEFVADCWNLWFLVFFRLIFLFMMAILTTRWVFLDGLDSRSPESTSAINTLTHNVDIYPLARGSVEATECFEQWWSRRSLLVGLETHRHGVPLPELTLG